jgi:archaellum component FlaC
MIQRIHSNIPNPDPSIITSEAIDRRVENATAVLNARIDGMATAVEVFQANLTRVPTELDRAIKGLRELLEARLASLELNVDRIEERSLGNVVVVQDALIELQKLASTTEERFLGLSLRFEERVDERDTAVKDAFAAQNELQTTIAAGFTKSIDALEALLSGQTNANNEKISDLKDRLTAIENRTAGMTTANTENRAVNTDNSARMMSILAIVIATAVGIGDIIVRLSGHP